MLKKISIYNNKHSNLLINKGRKEEEKFEATRSFGKIVPPTGTVD